MAWAQVYDGVNDYSGNSLVSAMSGDFTLKYVGQVSSLPMTTFGNILVIYLGNSDYLGVAVQDSGGTLLPKIISNGKTGGNGSTVIALNTDYTLEVRYVSSTNTASFYVDGVFDYSVNPAGGGTWVQTLTDYRFGFSITSSTSYGALLLKDGCEIIDSTTPANSLSFSPTSSSHAAGTPILDDTSLNNLDATGVNMPTDGSAWVDLGGSGTVTAESGTYSYTGTEAQLLTTKILKADSGVYLYTGTTASLLKGFVLTANSGSYSYLGQEAALTYTPAGAFILSADSGNYSYTGSNINFNRDRVIIANSGTYTYNGTDIQIILPGQIWTDKPSVSTNWNNQINATTIWTDK